MDDWIQALTNASHNELYTNKSMNGAHSWYVCSHARPTFCNVCAEALTGVTSHGLSCQICKFKAHKRCVSKVIVSCKWTTLASVDTKQLIENEDRKLSMPHQWIEGNLPVNARCSHCDKACGSVLHMQDYRCLWCKAYVHTHCMNSYAKICDLGTYRVSILPPTHIDSITSDGFIQASKAPNSSPLVVFINSKSGDNQGVKFLRRFRQLLNPFQVFDLVNGGPIVGLKLFEKFDCFRVLVCGGDGSVGWVLKEIDSLNLHKQCQIGVLPLGTGNDLARVLGWGAALDDDNQLPKLLEMFERATTKMLDRWSIMTYTFDTSKQAEQSNLASNEGQTSQDNLNNLESLIVSNLNNIVVNESAQQVIQSTRNLNANLIKLQFNFVNNIFFGDNFIHNSKLNTIHTFVKDQLSQFDKKLSEFYSLLKSELKIWSGAEIRSGESTETSSTNSGECDSDQIEYTINQKLKAIEAFFRNESIQLAARSNSLYRKQSLSKISKRFKNRQKILIKQHCLKKMIRQIIQLIDVLILFDSIKICPEESSSSLSSLNRKINDLLLSKCSPGAQKNNVPNSSSSLSINRHGLMRYESACPLASEEQSCMSSPNASKLSRSIDSLCKNFDSLNRSSIHTCSHNVSIRILSPSNEPSLKSFNDSDHLLPQEIVPDILVDDIFDTSVSNGLRHSIFNSKSVPGLNVLSDFKEHSMSQQILYPVVSSTCLNNSLNASSFISSTSSNYLSTTCIPSAFSSSSTCLNKTPVPSPRISKKYYRAYNKNHLKPPSLMSALSLNSLKNRSNSKSSEKSSSPTSPTSTKFSFKYTNDSALGFIGQALLFNANTLCAPVAPPVVQEPYLDLFSESTVMNNYFGIGIDAKLCLDFHITREEHPEKCKSRIRNHMLYSILGSKELLQRTYRNLEQKVRLECDGIKIPLKNVQGIVVLNIPSYTGGVNFWGPNSRDENVFITPSFDDKILEVVAITGAIQMALSRVVSLKSNRIAQCRSIKIQILGNEGVPVQVDGEAWIQPPGYVQIVHKNRAQMLTRNKIFEHMLKTWSEKQKCDPHMGTDMAKDELQSLQRIVDDSSCLIKRIKTASLRNVFIEQDLNGYAIQAGSNLEAICVNGKMDEKATRQQITDFLNSIRTLIEESNIFINEKTLKNVVEADSVEKIQLGLNDLKIDLKKLNDCHGIYQFPLDEDKSETKRSKFSIVERYKKSKLRQKDDRELLKTLHSIPLQDWGIEEVCLWLESLNLSEYKESFVRHDIRGTEIRNLERRDLRELGIVKIGHLKRILNAAKDIPKRIAIEKKSV